MGEHRGQATAYGFSLTHARVTFLNSLRPYWSSLCVGSVLLLITNLLMAYLPILINAGVVRVDSGTMYPFSLYFWSTDLDFFPLLALIVVLAVCGAVLRTLSRRVIFDVGRSIERDVRKRLFFHLSALDEGFFHKNSVGDLMNHLSTDIANIRMMAGFAALNLMNIVFVFIFTVPLLVTIDTMLALCALLPFPLIILTTRSMSKQMFQRTVDYQAELSKLISHVQENLLGAHVVRLFHQQDQENERFHGTSQATYKAGVRLVRVRVLMQPIMRLMIGLAVGLVLYAGGLAVAVSRISIGDFVEINTRILQLAWPAMSVGFVMSVLSRGRASLSRINHLLSVMPNIRDGQDVVSNIQKLDVKSLNLTSDNNHHESPLSFTLSRGEMLGIVGPSGSYKSTLLRALCRRIVVPRQTIRFDNHDISNLTLSSLYGEIAIVSEDSFLFHKSIRENICFANPHATTQEIIDALSLTRLDRDITNFTDGLDTVVGDRGITLSGGQRQRVALARALLAKRSILILDDALSAVDADTERHIISRLRNYVRDSIVIIATHRLSAIKDAELIVVLDQGRLKERGTHRELMKRSQLYQQLWGLDQLQGQWT